MLDFERSELRVVLQIGTVPSAGCTRASLSDMHAFDIHVKRWAVGSQCVKRKTSLPDYLRFVRANLLRVKAVGFGGNKVV